VVSYIVHGMSVDGAKQTPRSFVLRNDRIVQYFFVEAPALGLISHCETQQGFMCAPADPAQRSGAAELPLFASSRVRVSTPQAR
jgi:hypothetical protein